VKRRRDLRIQVSKDLKESRIKLREPNDVDRTSFWTQKNLIGKDGLSSLFALQPDP
jgi:hypothetical protein